MANEPCLLLTGGTGFVGQHLIPELRAHFPGYRRVLLCRTNEREAREGFELEHSELADEQGIDRIMAKHRPEIIVHMAAQTSVARAVGAEEETWRVNFLGSLTLASAVSRHTRRGTFLFASTAEVYGRSLSREPADEDTPAHPVNAYASSKFAAEQMLSDVLAPDVGLIITRAFNHSGAGQDERFVLASFAAQIARIEAAKSPARMMVGNLGAERDFLHVGDVVDAYVRLLSGADHLERRTLVNVASGRAWKISDLLESMRGMARAPFEVVQDPARMRASDIPVMVGDATKLHRLTGWAPRRPIPDMLNELLDKARADVRAL
jgi:GDP-4-dehydro-6-deoxy-D-mannose reductase